MPLPPLIQLFHLSPRGVLALQLAALSVAMLAPVPGLAQEVVTTPAPAQQSVKSSYVLGPGDEFTIKAMDAEELSGTPYRVDSSGNVRLQFVGTVRCGGLTVEELEKELAVRLQKYVKDPSVSIRLTELRSRPISVIGAVRNPGVHQLQGDGTLVEMISGAGGLMPDAGNNIRITRKLEYGAIPLPGAANDSTGHYSVAEVNVKALLDSRDPASNIAVRPNDVISVPKADLVYVMGEVKKSGGFTVKDHEQVSVLQAISLAEGFDRSADRKQATILRLQPGSSVRTRIPVNLAEILKGKQKDMPMEADDILFVPLNGSRNAFLRTAEVAIQIGTGVAIYRR